MIFSLLALGDPPTNLEIVEDTRGPCADAQSPYDFIQNMKRRALLGLDPTTPEARRVEFQYSVCGEPTSRRIDLSRLGVQQADGRPQCEANVSLAESQDYRSFVQIVVQNSENPSSYFTELTRWNCVRRNAPAECETRPEIQESGALDVSALTYFSTLQARTVGCTVMEHDYFANACRSSQIALNNTNLQNLINEQKTIQNVRRDTCDAAENQSLAQHRVIALQWALGGYRGCVRETPGGDVIIRDSPVPVGARALLSEKLWDQEDRTGTPLAELVMQRSTPVTLPRQSIQDTFYSRDRCGDGFQPIQGENHQLVTRRDHNASLGGPSGVIRRAAQDFMVEELARVHLSSLEERSRFLEGYRSGDQARRNQALQQARFWALGTPTGEEPYGAHFRTYANDIGHWTGFFTSECERLSLRERELEQRLEDAVGSNERTKETIRYLMSWEQRVAKSVRSCIERIQYVNNIRILRTLDGAAEGAQPAPPASPSGEVIVTDEGEVTVKSVPDPAKGGDGSNATAAE